MPHMYILLCSDKTYYVGSTWDIERRLRQHNEGRGANYTKERLPVKLVYKEYFDRVEDAYNRERQIHNWSRAKKEALIKDQSETLKPLAKKKFHKRTPPVENN